MCTCTQAGLFYRRSIFSWTKDAGHTVHFPPLSLHAWQMWYCKHITPQTNAAMGRLAIYRGHLPNIWCTRNGMTAIRLSYLTNVINSCTDKTAYLNLNIKTLYHHLSYWRSIHCHFCEILKSRGDFMPKYQGNHSLSHRRVMIGMPFVHFSA